MIHSMAASLLLLVTLPALVVGAFADFFENVHQKITVPLRARKNK